MSAPFEPFDDFEELGEEREECAAPVPWSVPCRRYVSLTDTAGRDDYWHSHEVDLFPLVPFTGAKKDLACLVFATFVGKRCAANVQSVTAIAIDVDEWPGSVESFAIAVANLRKCCAWYTTFSATQESPRFRIVFAMSRPLSAAEYPVFWRIVVRVLERSGLKGIDESCKDCSRVWFVPAVPPSGFYVADQAEGDALNVDAVLSTGALLTRGARPPLSRPRPILNASGMIRRAQAYLSSMPEAISGQHGHDAAFRVAQVLVRKFGLADDEALPLFSEWSARCEPPWSEKDLFAKASRGEDSRTHARRRFREERVMTFDEQLASLPELSREESEDHFQSESRPVIETVGVTEIFAKLPPVPYVCEGLGLAPGAPVLVAGYGFSGKTLAAQSLGLAMAAGKRAWGVYSMDQGRVLHLDYEQGKRQTFERYQRLAKGMGVDERELQSSDRLRVAIHPPVYLDEKGSEEVFERAMDGFTFVILDSLRAAAGNADENSSEIRKCLDSLNRAAEKTGATVLVIHHARKPNGEKGAGAKFGIRGSGAIFDACASVFMFAAEKGEPTRVLHEKDRNRGITMEDFGLRVEDIEINGDKRAGLVVHHLEGAQLARMQEPKLEKAKADVIAYLTKFGPFSGSRNRLQGEIGGRKEMTMAALRELMDAGEIIESGRGKSQTISIGPGDRFPVPDPRGRNRESVPGNRAEPSGTDQEEA